MVPQRGFTPAGTENFAVLASGNLPETVTNCRFGSGQN
jgi:hypothetical protein